MEIDVLFNNFLQYIFNFILKPNFVGPLFYIKITFLILDAFCIGFIIWALIKTHWLKWLILSDLKEFFTYQPYGLRKYLKEWKKIRERIATGQEAEIKLGLIEAEKILDEVLKNMGYPGENLDERLENLTTDILSNLEQIRKTHKMISNIIHDPTYKLDMTEVKEAMEVFKNAFLELEVL